MTTTAEQVTDDRIILAIREIAAVAVRDPRKSENGINAIWRLLCNVMPDPNKEKGKGIDQWLKPQSPKTQQ